MKLALVTPRYGAEITHGAGHVCQLIAERLCERHEVDVLTTCARDPETWKNEYPEGADRVRGVLVRRFAASGRDPHTHRGLSQRLHTSAHSRSDELEWVRRSGSTSAGLVDFIRRQHRSYEALVFFSCWAGTTVHGIQVAPERSVLFPCATLDPALRLWTSHDVLLAASAVGYCSHAERGIVRAHVRRPPPAEEIIGVGIADVHESRYPRLEDGLGDESTEDDSAPENIDRDVVPSHLAGRGVLFRRRHRLHGRFALYGGSVASDNGTEELIEYFDAYASQDGEAARLVLMGVKLMKLPSAGWLHSGGVLTDAERLAALAAADVALAPDPDDLLGEQALEAFAAGTPVLASALNMAAVEHIKRSNAGLYYANREEFVEALRLLMSNDRLRQALARNGRRYVQQHYRWDAVLGRLERLVARIKGGR